MKGTAFVTVKVQPGYGYDFVNAKPTYTGPKRISGPGPVLETAKTCDFEADLGWAIGVERRLPLTVAQDGDTVTVGFG